MKTRFALPAVLALSLSTVALAPIAPARADSPCTFDPETVNLTVDPVVLEDPMSSPDPSLYRPETVNLSLSSTITDGYATVSLTAAGQTFGPTGVIAPIVPGSSSIPGIGLYSFLFQAGATLWSNSDAEFLAEYPTVDDFFTALTNPGFYPASVTIAIAETQGGPAACSLTINIDIGGSDSERCTGQYGSLCAYYDRLVQQGVSSDLPDTL